MLVDLLECLQRAYVKSKKALEQFPDFLEFAPIQNAMRGVQRDLQDFANYVDDEEDEGEVSEECEDVLLSCVQYFCRLDEQFTIVHIPYQPLYSDILPFVVGIICTKLRKEESKEDIPLVENIGEKQPYAIFNENQFPIQICHAETKKQGERVGLVILIPTPEEVYKFFKRWVSQNRKQRLQNKEEDHGNGKERPL